MNQRVMLGQYPHGVALETRVGAFYPYMEQIKIVFTAGPFHFGSVGVRNLVVMA